MEEMTMGERRSVDGLPNFIFVREKAREADGFELAGKLVTDIPKDEEPSDWDRQLLIEIFEALVEAVRRDPEMDGLRIWRGRVKPSDALEGPLPDAMMLARIRRCHVGGLRLDLRDGGYLKLSDIELADIVGRHLASTLGIPARSRFSTRPASSSRSATCRASPMARRIGRRSMRRSWPHHWLREGRPRGLETTSTPLQGGM
jgi:hypothetical protein